MKTPGPLRRTGVPGAPGSARVDEITRRRDAAAARRFPIALQERHTELIEQGQLGKGGLAWMLGVDQDLLEIAEPEPVTPLGSDALAAELGLLDA